MIYPILWLIVALISLLPVYIFWIGYRKTHSKDLFVTSLAFTLFLVKAITLSVALFLDGLNEEKWYFDDEFWVGIAALLDMIIIGLIASALMGKFGPSNGREPTIPPVTADPPPFTPETTTSAPDSTPPIADPES